MNPTDTLSHEHRSIEVVLSALEHLATRADTDQDLDAGFALDLVEFLKEYADRRHHDKEEELLFPLLEQRGMSPHQGPTAVMRHEHEMARGLVAKLESSARAHLAGDDPAIEEFVRAALTYVSLLRSHIQKEDHCLFPMAEQALTADDKRELGERFVTYDNSPEVMAAAERCEAILRRAREELERSGGDARSGAAASPASASGCCG